MSKSIKRHLAVTATLAATFFALQVQAHAGDDELGVESGETATPANAAWIASPLPNATFPGAPASIDVVIEVDPQAGLDVTTIRLELDFESVGEMPCAEGCTFTGVEVPQGEHTLSLDPEYGDGTAITIYVDAEPPPASTDDGDPPKGCSVGDSPSAPWGLLTLPALLLIPGFRRPKSAQLRP